MSESKDRSSLQQTRNSIRSRVSREGLAPRGVPVDLTPVVEGARRRLGNAGLWMLALICLGAVAVVMLQPRHEPLSVTGKPVATLELVRGPVSMLPEGGLRASSRRVSLEVGTELPVGAIVETGAADGGTALRLEGGGSMRLDSNTRLRLTSSSAVVLDRGAVYFDSAPRQGDRSAELQSSAVEVRTTLGMVREIGTQFEVRLVAEGDEPSALRVRVREGRVVLRHGQESHEAEAGDELTLSDDGSVVRRPAEIYGRHWDWVLETAPLPQVEGQALQTFLEWFAREGGWTLHFSDPDLATEAPTIIMHGDIEDLSPQQAAEVVLGSSQLEYRVEDRRLVITPAGDR